MIIKKRVKNESNDKGLNKYEFDLFFIDNINEKKDDNTYIVVEQKSDIEEAFNAINSVNKNIRLHYFYQ